MRFSTTIAIAFAASAIAAPTKRALKRRAVLADTTYDDISISGGTAGNAEAEALAVFSALDLNDLANVDAGDLEFLGAVNDVANDAETEAFNTAIEAATGDEATALQNGKIKNKVLKLMATKIELEAKAAQGEDTAAKLEEELKKLNNNIALDAEAAGQPSTAVAFDATISGGGAVTGGGATANGGANAAANTASKATASNDATDAADATQNTDDEDAADDEEVADDEAEAADDEADEEEADNEDDD